MEPLIMWFPFPVVPFVSWMDGWLDQDNSHWYSQQCHSFQGSWLASLTRAHLVHTYGSCLVPLEPEDGYDHCEAPAMRVIISCDDGIKKKQNISTDERIKEALTLELSMIKGKKSFFTTVTLNWNCSVCCWDRLPWTLVSNYRKKYKFQPGKILRKSAWLA